jgi:hypothetical protein
MQTVVFDTSGQPDGTYDSETSPTVTELVFGLYGARFDQFTADSNSFNLVINNPPPTPTPEPPTLLMLVVSVLGLGAAVNKRWFAVRV